MTNYQLAKLILMAGGLNSRKRIQKTVRLLKAARCQVNLDDFRLHYYGPYSAELAETLDRMTTNGMLIESQEDTQVGAQYNYTFNDALMQSLLEFEKTPDGTAAKEEMESYKELVLELNKVRPRILELASTIVEFLDSGQELDDAQANTASFKHENYDSPMMRDARKLAESITSCADG